LREEAVRDGIGVEGDEFDPIADACRQSEALLDFRREGDGRWRIESEAGALGAGGRRTGLGVGPPQEDGGDGE
jgi:hypothetical protein